ncbi:hypothetical protein Tco_0436010 [Tanacetum coccineum]
MANLKFADTHNMVAILSIPEESDGFEQIVDFLNAHPIKYALTINPTIYTSCIEQFWSTVKAKTSNGEVQLHALVDGKKIIVIESTVRRDLQLKDAEGIDCLPKSTIFEILTRMGSKTTAWNEFSSTIASAIICLATNHKFNFSKYIFESMVRNLDNLSRNFLMYPRKSKRKDTKVPQPSRPTYIIADEAVHKELGDILVRGTPNEAGSQGTTSGGGPRCQETIGDTIAQTRFENVSKLSNDSLLVRGNTLRSDEDSLKLKELMELCTNLQQRVLDLEKTKTTQQNEIISLKRRVKKLEQKKRSRIYGLKRLHNVGMSRRVVSSGDEKDLSDDASKQERKINVIDADEDITLVNVQDDDDNEMFDVDTLTGDEVIVEQEVAAKDVNLTIDELLWLKHFAANASIKVSAATTTTATIPTPRKGIVIIEVGTHIITRSLQQPSQAEVQDKGKGKMIEPKPVKPKKKDVQIMLDEEATKKLQADFDEEERLVREKDEANVALTEEWYDIQAKIEANHELAQRLQAEEQEELSDAEKGYIISTTLREKKKAFCS